MPAFGSHNIRSLSHACCYAESRGLTPRDFEVQVLYGMAEPIAKAFESRGYLTRMYVPLGDLLPGRLVSHHMRLLGVLARHDDADWLVLVDCDRTE